jgi:competence protein ComEA
MNLSRDESRALGFIALLLALSAGARLLDRPKPVSLDASAVDTQALEQASRAAKEAGEAASKPLGPGERIDPNTAPVDQLMRLPRVGRAVADRIVAERAKAPFRTLADLDRVRGVGAATLKEWEGRVSLPDGGAARPAQYSTAPPQYSTPPEPPRPQRPARSEPVAVNRATAAELERVPGIGPSLAARIVAYRDSVGGLRSLDELERIRGIGPATLVKLKPHLRL